jgi:hypothetical protein
MVFSFVFCVFLFLHLGGASFLTAAQMCFYAVKRKSRLKPANFFVACRRAAKIPGLC